MPKHKPIKFQKTLKPSLQKMVEDIIEDNPNAKKILNVTLGIIATGGIITFAAAFPNVAGEIIKLQKNRRKKKFEEYRKIWRQFNLLKKQNYIEIIEEKDDCLVCKLSKNGEEKIRQFVMDELSVKKQKKWDKKWRLIIFDIPEKYKQARRTFRFKLQEMGFYQCQKSVWIHMFPCAEEIEFLKKILKIESFVKIFLVEEMTDGKTLYNFRNQIKQSL